MDRDSLNRTAINVCDAISTARRNDTGNGLAAVAGLVFRDRVKRKRTAR